MTNTTDPPLAASEHVENQRPRKPKKLLSWERCNEVTWKLTDGVGILTWRGKRVLKQEPRAVAWLMAAGNEKWIVRYRDMASRPMKLPKAKVYAVEMVRGIRPGRVIADPIRELHRVDCIVESYSRKANRLNALE